MDMSSIFLLAFLAIAGAQQTTDTYRCSPNTLMLKSNTDTLRMLMPSNCTEGGLHWGYPGLKHQYLRAVFLRPDLRDFTLCLSGWSSFGLKAVYKAAGYGIQRIPSPTQEFESCFGSIHGIATVILEAEEPISYMAGYSYRIVTDE